jgi:hypothetical protein
MGTNSKTLVAAAVIIEETSMILAWADLCPFYNSNEN